MAACWEGHTDTAKVLVENRAVVDLLNKVILLAKLAVKCSYLLHCVGGSLITSYSQSIRRNVGRKVPDTTWSSSQPTH